MNKTKISEWLSLKPAFENIFIFGMGLLSSSIVNIIFIPIFTWVLLPHEYGLFAVIMTYTAFVNLFIQMGLPNALMRYYFENNNESYRKCVCSTILAAIGINLFIYLTLFLIFRAYISKLFFNGVDNYLIFLICLSSILTNFIIVFQTIIKVMQRSVLFTSIFITSTILNILLKLLLVVYYKRGVYGILESHNLVNIIVFCYLAYLTRKNFIFIFSKRIFKSTLKFGIPLVPAAILVWIMDLADRLIIKQLLSLHYVGIYNVGYSAGMMIKLLIISPFALGYSPIAMSVWSTGVQMYARMQRIVFLFFSGISLICALGISLYAPYIIKLLTAVHYHSAYKVVPYISTAYVLFGIYQIIGSPLTMKKKTQYYPIFLFFCALVNVILNYILIPKYKLDGAGFATLFAYGFLLVLAFKIAQHTFKIDYDISKVGILLSIYGFIQIINFQFNNLILTSLSFFIYVLVTLLLIKPHDLSILELIIKGFKLKH